MPHCSVMSMGTPLFISKLKFSWDKYSVDKVWTKIYCHFYFRGITLRSLMSLLLSENDVRFIHWMCLKTRCTGPCAWNRTYYSYQDCFLTWKTIRKSCFWVLWAFSNFSVSSSSCCCFLCNSSSGHGSGLDSPFASPGWKQQSNTSVPRDCYGLYLKVTLLTVYDTC